MIHVTIYRNAKKVCVGFQTEGHAGYDEIGQDIVCAAASVLVVNTINAIELYAGDKYSLLSDDETGFISFHLQKEPTREAALLLKTMILGLKEMAHDENYAEYIQLKFEEV